MIKHYEFGKNWKKFVDSAYAGKRCETAAAALLNTLPFPDLKCKKALDIGRGGFNTPLMIQRP